MKITCDVLDLQQTKKKINVVLIGKTGSGKSSTGNLIIGDNVFETADENLLQSCTSSISLNHRNEGNLTFNVMDTPGLFDTRDITNEENLREFTKTAIDFPEGVDVFLIVSRLDQPFTEEEQESFKKLKVSKCKFNNS